MKKSIDENLTEWLVTKDNYGKYGFNQNGIGYAVLGNTYEIKDQLKAEGAKWCNPIKCWVFPNKPENYETLEVNVSDIYVLEDDGSFDTDWTSENVNKLSKQIKLQQNQTKAKTAKTINDISDEYVVWDESLVPIRLDKIPDGIQKAINNEDHTAFNSFGYSKVNETGGSYVMSAFYNPQDNTFFTAVVDDYDYDYVRNPFLKNMSIDTNTRHIYMMRCNEIRKGDMVAVVKGNKVPEGTVGVVIKENDYTYGYGRRSTTYLVLDNGISVAESNCVVCIPKSVLNGNFKQTFSYIESMNEDYFTTKPDYQYIPEYTITVGRNEGIDGSLKAKLEKAITDYFVEEGFEADEAKEYFVVEIRELGKKETVVEVRAELSYDGLFELTERLDKIVQGIDKDAYFDMEEPGIACAYIYK